jgi:hypothetical protein
LKARARVYSKLIAHNALKVEPHCWARSLLSHPFLPPGLPLTKVFVMAEALSTGGKDAGIVISQASGGRPKIA